MTDKEKNYEEKIAFLDTHYIEVESLKQANIFHLYPIGDQCYPDGYYDSQFFDVVAYNTVTKERWSSNGHDGLEFDKDVPVLMTRVYIDGSFMVRLYNVADILYGQCIQVV